jgi:hypothetical protein
MQSNAVTFKDIVDRVVLIDYYPGTHGHFLTHALHSLIHNYHDNNDYTKNYRLSKFLPSYLETDKPLHESDAPVYTGAPWAQGTNKIFWPLHWSNYWNKKQQKGQLKNVPVVEIIVTPKNWFRCYTNFWFNVGDIPKDQILDPAWFVDNFYNVASKVNMANLLQGQTHFDRDQVVELFEQEIYRAHGMVYDPDNASCESVLDTFELDTFIHKFDVDYFYTFDKFYTAIDQINQIFKLGIDLTQENVYNIWEPFGKHQHKLSALDFQINDAELHPIELAYRNFVKKSQ